jgi:GNAT superfamily N-acetyltransferase
MIERVDERFESEIVGRPIVRLKLGPDVKASELDAAIGEASGDGVRYLLTTLPAGDHPRAWALGERGFRLMDVTITLRRDKSRERESTMGSPEVRLAQPEDLAPIAEYATQLFPLSRYYADPFYTREQADEIHRRWIANAFGGRAAAIFVAEYDGKAAGFMTVMESGASGRVDLFGVAKHASGRGLGSKIIQTALAWLDQRTSDIVVKTQAYNFTAIALYARYGFAHVETDLTFTKLLP